LRISGVTPENAGLQVFVFKDKEFPFGGSGMTMEGFSIEFVCQSDLEDNSGLHGIDEGNG
jgi:hypothetical protein